MRPSGDRARTRAALATAMLLAGAVPARAGSEAAREAVEARIAASGAEVSVAFRLLDGGDELLLRPDEVYHAASTMKVPVMIELYAEAAAGELSLDEPLVVSDRFASIVDGSPYALSPADDSETGLYERVGEPVPLGRLCEAMIQQSSNLATTLLISRLGVQRIRARTADLGAQGMLVLRGVEDGEAFRRGLNNTTTARALLRLLEAIARGEAADPASSQAMEALLRGQHFVDGIPAGIPPGVPIANKTGSITRIHHDAAIVRAPHPFVLVVLTRGIEDDAESGALMADVARLLYAATQPAP